MHKFKITDDTALGKGHGHNFLSVRATAFKCDMWQGVANGIMGNWPNLHKFKIANNYDMENEHGHNLNLLTVRATMFKFVLWQGIVKGIV